MAVKVDISKSEQSRTDGNNAFKKGKWVEAIGCYTNAIIYNPQDPTAYANRAQAFLKLDKFNDAERDCTTVLSLEGNGGKSSIKAYYRRALARKGLGNIDDAIQDIEQVLKLDKSNQVAATELEELQELKAKLNAKKKTPRRPLSPPRAPVPAAGPTTSPHPILASTSSATSSPSNSSAGKLKSQVPSNGNTKPEPDSANVDSLPSDTDGLNVSLASSLGPSPVSTRSAPMSTPPPAQEPSVAPSSFASLRQSREGKKKAFVGSSGHRQGQGQGQSSTPSSSAVEPAVEKEYLSPDSTEKTKPDPLDAIFPKLSTGSKPRSNKAENADSSSSTAPSLMSPHIRPAAPRGATDSEPTADIKSKQSSIPPLPTNLDTTSLSPGAGLLLLRHISPTSPEFNWALLSLYPPTNVAKILGPLLEPDNLGLILLALDHGINHAAPEQQPNVEKGNVESDRIEKVEVERDSLKTVKEILTGLKATKRWRMNVDMLSKSERQAGERAWKACSDAGLVGPEEKFR